LKNSSSPAHRVGNLEIWRKKCGQGSSTAGGVFRGTCAWAPFEDEKILY